MLSFCNRTYDNYTLAKRSNGDGRKRGRGVGSREWRQDHFAWKAEALRRYLNGASPREVEAAVFEVLQREAYLTSCEISVRNGRDELVGWRLMDRIPEEYGSVVVESVLERAGFDLGLESIFSAPRERVAQAPVRPRARYGRGVRTR